MSRLQGACRVAVEALEHGFDAQLSVAHGPCQQIGKVKATSAKTLDLRADRNDFARSWAGALAQQVHHPSRQIFDVRRNPSPLERRDHARYRAAVTPVSSGW